MKPRIITRWEKHVQPDGYISMHTGKLDVTVKEPARGEGWERCLVRVYPDFEYLSREPWQARLEGGNRTDGND